MKTTMLAALAAGAMMLGAVPARAEAMDCAAVTQRQIEDLFDRWNKSLATLDPVKVAANYAPDAVLLPTVSNTPRTDPAMIQDYFVHFLEKHPQGVINTHTIRIGCNLATDVGTYTFLIDGKNPGEQVVVPARYSFVYVRKDGEWLIAHHHSSAMPEPVIAVTAAAKEH
ncbi:SgcJ/EcaC family oxidoreductase [Methylobacterium terricola]|uniref:SgcJ/EcaC family oxidoreductase n=1 Tax=Methylobacterium terricola TaxID=2583531 RepID=A0A5C4LDF3_9HYPH|nr:SgcJ/EcaC family oxidoreductase [Methylobacterium terricola]TNC09854.1 SgcJ/EcaC family oxidoreductase [Methylobacterium terricola]